MNAPSGNPAPAGTSVSVDASDADAGQRLDRILAAGAAGLSRSRVKALIEDGRVRCGARTIVDPSYRVKPGERFEISIPAAIAATPEAQSMPLSVVYEDEHLIVIDKPAGLVVHPGAGVPDRTLLNALLAHAPELAAVPRAGIVHRLDKDTSGLLVVARNVSAQAKLAEQLAARTVRRVYLALVHGDPPAQGTIDAPIGRDTRARTRMAVTQRGKEARTRYRVIERFGHAALVECRLETGRTHQIRVHFQHIRHPLVGDAVYRRGTRQGLALPRQALHAVELELRHPRSGKTLAWRSPLPRDMAKVLEGLRRGA
jgi:23S rRNA pseudouridine1911/1915/1917 synthase